MSRLLESSTLVMHPVQGEALKKVRARAGEGMFRRRARVVAELHSKTRLVATVRAARRAGGMDDSCPDGCRPGDGPYRCGNIGIAVVGGVLAMSQDDVSFSDGEECFGTSYQGLARQVQALCDDPMVRGVMLAIDSPGGDSMGIRQCCELMRAACEQSNKPMWAYVCAMACSGGYWLACAADRILMGPDAETGSIGTYAIYWDESKALDEMGIKPNAEASTPTKLIGFSGRAMTDAERGVIKAELAQIDSDFVAAVMKGRKCDAQTVDSWRMNIRYLRGQAAVDGGMADELCLTLGDAVERMQNAVLLSTQHSALSTQNVSQVRDARGPDAGILNGSALKGQQPMAKMTLAHLEAAEGGAELIAHIQAEARKGYVEAEKPATIAQIEAEFPGSSSDFVLGAVKANLTLGECRGRKAEADAAQVKTLTEQVAKLSAELATAKESKAKVEASLKNAGVSAGHPGVSASPGSGGAGGGDDPVATFNARVQEAVKGGLSLEAATTAVIKADPEGHKAYLKATQSKRK